MLEREPVETPPGRPGATERDVAERDVVERGVAERDVVERVDDVPEAEREVEREVERDAERDSERDVERDVDRDDAPEVERDDPRVLPCDRVPRRDSSNMVMERSPPWLSIDQIHRGLTLDL